MRHQDAYTVIRLNGTMTLQNQHRELSAMLLGYEFCVEPGPVGR